MRKNIVLRSIFKVNRAINSMTICCLLCITSYASAFTRDYLCFTAEEVDASVALKKYGKPANKMTLMYSLDGAKWKNYSMGKVIPLSNVGNKVYFKAKHFKNIDDSSSNFLSDYYHFELPKKVSASGNIMSLLDSTCQRNDVPRGAFSSLFIFCTYLMTAPKLPATELAEDCYLDLFAGCTSLKEAPQLPATQLAEECYNRMFAVCINLKETPLLPATELSEKCYCSMFAGCTSLTQVHDLPATTLARNCYNNMFGSCTSLTKAPKLPATKLTDGCYASMFKNCTKLNSISVAFSEWDSRKTSAGSYSTRDWLSNVAPYGTFICTDSLPQKFGDSYIPTGWTVQRKPVTDTNTSADKHQPNTKTK